MIINKILKYILCVQLFIFNVSAVANEFISQLTMQNASNFNHFIIGGQPSESDLELFAQQGKQYIINLRAEGEFSQFNEQALVERLGMEYITLPIAGATDITPESLKAFKLILDTYSRDAVIHCASGNRVGALFALDAAINQSKSVTEAIFIGRTAGLTRLERRVIQVLNEVKQD